MFAIAFDLEHDADKWNPVFRKTSCDDKGREHHAVCVKTHDALVVADTQAHHPKGVPQAYADIRTTLDHHGFSWIQGSLYVSEVEDMAVLFAAIMALKALPWFPPSVRDIHAFRIEQGSDFPILVTA